MRASLIASVEEMSKTVEQMIIETEQTKRALEVELSNYRSRLAHTEQATMLDPLTGLANRRLEGDLALRIRRGQPFCLLLIDLNGFKVINDTHGHLAGDQILRQFASELNQVCHQSDLGGRWGGDEFLVLFNGMRSQGELMVQRIEQWVWGTYPIKMQPGVASIKVEVKAAIGLGVWNQSLSADQLVQQADLAMYRRNAEIR